VAAIQLDSTPSKKKDKIRIGITKILANVKMFGKFFI